MVIIWMEILVVNNVVVINGEMHNLINVNHVVYNV